MKRSYRLKPKTRLKRIVARNRGDKKTKEKSISKLIKEADRLMSLRVRQKYATPEPAGEVYCYTCNHPMHWRKSQCGHFISRYYKSIRWDENNCRVQCFMCNIAKRGDPITFRENLIGEIGEEAVLSLEKKRTESIKLTREFLEAKIKELQ